MSQSRRLYHTFSRLSRDFLRKDVKTFAGSVFRCVKLGETPKKSRKTLKYPRYFSKINAFYLYIPLFYAKSVRQSAVAK